MDLLTVLGRSRELGFLGPGPVEVHLGHARSYLPLLGHASAALDLGSGGGVPGLVLALEGSPSIRWTLLDANQRRCAFLREAVATLQLSDQVDVVDGRAEEVGRDPARRGMLDLVVARSFGAPAVVAECAAPLLAPQGRLIVSEPPASESDSRWPTEGLAELGLGPPTLVPGEARLALMTLTGQCPDRFPRRNGVPAKRPLF